MLKKLINWVPEQKWWLINQSLEGKPVRNIPSDFLPLLLSLRLFYILFCFNSRLEQILFISHRIVSIIQTVQIYAKREWILQMTTVTSEIESRILCRPNRLNRLNENRKNLKTLTDIKNKFISNLVNYVWNY